MNLRTLRIAQPFETIAEHFEKDSLNTLKHNSLPFSLLQELVHSSTFSESTSCHNHKYCIQYQA